MFGCEFKYIWKKLMLITIIINFDRIIYRLRKGSSINWPASFINSLRK